MDFPRHVHKANGEFLVVANQKELKAALGKGWATTPVLTDEQKEAVKKQEAAYAKAQAEAEAAEPPPPAE